NPSPTPSAPGCLPAANGSLSIVSCASLMPRPSSRSDSQTSPSLYRASTWTATACPGVPAWAAFVSSCTSTARSRDSERGTAGNGRVQTTERRVQALPFAVLRRSEVEGQTHAATASVKGGDRDMIPNGGSALHLQLPALAVLARDSGGERAGLVVGQVCNLPS